MKNKRFWEEDSQFEQYKKRPCRPVQDVIYYQCKDPRIAFKKCDCLIEKTDELIELLESKNQTLEALLMTANENQNIANEGIVAIESELNTLATGLVDIGIVLSLAQEELNSIIEELVNQAIPYQQDAILAVNDALAKQTELEMLLEKLECAFRDTIKCLKSVGIECPVFIPTPKFYCDCEDEDDEYDESGWGWEE